MLIELALLMGGGTGIWRLTRHKDRKRLSMADCLTNPTESVRWPPKPKPVRISLVRLTRDLCSAFSLEGNRQLNESLDPALIAENARQCEQAKQRFWFSIGAGGLALAGTLYPVFYWVGAGTVLYLAQDLIAAIRRDFSRKTWLSVNTIGIVSLLGMIAVGQLFLAALCGVIGGIFLRAIVQAETRSRQNLTNIFGIHPAQVWVLKEGVEIALDFNDISKGQIIVVHAGEVVPVDGIVESGEGQLDQHILTGESQPVEKSRGDPVFAATLLLSGRLLIKVETAGSETLAARIGAAINQTQSYQDTLTNRGLLLANRFVPFNLILAAVTLPLLGPKSAIAINWALPGSSLSSSGPISVLNYLQILSQQAILVKDGCIFESLKQVDTVIFDKTGTLTLEQPTLVRIVSLDEWDETRVLRYAAAAEYRQTHPVAKAILAHAKELGLALPTVDDASYEVGFGIQAMIEGVKVRVGSARFIQKEQNLPWPESIAALQKEAGEEGLSLVFVAIGERVAGVLVLSPTLRPGIDEAIGFLKQRGIELYIISGDHEIATRTMARNLGIDHYFAETLPEKKADLVSDLRAAGRFVCFIGDGINDAVALKSAQVSISLKGASSAATDVAQIVLMDGTLNRLTLLFDLADDFEATMHRNKILSVVPAVITLGGIYLLHFGIAASIGICYLGYLGALINTLWPLAKYQEMSLEGVPHLAAVHPGTPVPKDEIAASD